MTKLVMKCRLSSDAVMFLTIWQLSHIIDEIFCVNWSRGIFHSL